MAELSQKERLQPSLLDRLTDDYPDERAESSERRSLSLAQLREIVKRDLARLFNACHLAATQDLAGYPLVEKSAVNFGMPDLTGITLSGLDIAGLERNLRQAIWDFEPRLVRNSVVVRAIHRTNEMSQNTLAFQIECLLWAQPAPIFLLLETKVDLEAGKFFVNDGFEQGR